MIIFRVTALAVISYLMFVFLSDSINPFTKAKSPQQRKKWRLGRSAAISSLVAGLIALWLLHTYVINQHLAIALYAIAGLLLFTPSIVKYKKRTI